MYLVNLRAKLVEKPNLTNLCFRQSIKDGIVDRGKND